MRRRRDELRGTAAFRASPRASSGRVEVLLVASRRRAGSVEVGAGEVRTGAARLIGDLECAVGLALRVTCPDGPEAAVDALLHFHLDEPRPARNWLDGAVHRKRLHEVEERVVVTDPARDELAVRVPTL